ncbi:hypothetical protein VKT23_012082 [Stygiomarasmius scandens]|uniref:Uncharacterized protein n=1 Tax=Marasmiellus scandens TaxID=2682957 RepID=A0ABR1J9I0_9AGAR
MWKNGLWPLSQRRTASGWRKRYASFAEHFDQRVNEYRRFNKLDRRVVNGSGHGLVARQRDHSEEEISDSGNDTASESRDNTESEDGDESDEGRSAETSEAFNQFNLYTQDEDDAMIEYLVDMLDSELLPTERDMWHHFVKNKEGKWPVSRQRTIAGWQRRYQRKAAYYEEKTMELKQARQQCTEAESRKAIHMPEEDDLEYLSAVDRWEISSDSSIDEVHDYLMGSPDESSGNDVVAWSKPTSSLWALIGK